LAQQGLYIDYGYLKCAFCNKTITDSREPITNIFAKNHFCFENNGFDTSVFVNKEFFDHSKRYNSLIKNSVLKNDAKSLAFYGWYIENDNIKTFCCGKCSDEKNVTRNKHVHENDCQYFRNVLK
jgi:hypothetical protein